MRVVGLDLSTRSCGIARTDGRLVTVQPKALKPKASPSDHARRLDEIERGVCAQVPEWTDLAVIEGYALHTHAGTLARLGEAAGVVKLRLWRMGVPFVLVPPAVLKRFACGKGNASKAEMVAACRAAGGDPANDDEADAFWLRRYGLEMDHG